MHLDPEYESHFELKFKDDMEVIVVSRAVLEV